MTEPRDRGHRNSNERGNSHQRRARKLWLLGKFGDGETAPCSDCATPLTFETIYVDRIKPAYLGGTYAQGNIQPHCRTCSCRQGAALRLVVLKLEKKRTAKPRTKKAA